MMDDYTILTEQQAWAEIDRLLLMLDLQRIGLSRERELCEALVDALTTDVRMVAPEWCPRQTKQDE